MKHIQKSPEPPELEAFRKEWAESGQTPKWEDLPGDVSKAMRSALIAEQGHICCYCGRKLVQNDNHIEHFVPRNGTMGEPALTFVWENLLASCQGNLLKGDPIHCGRKKDDWFDATLMVSPLDPGCEDRFRFEFDGRIRAMHVVDLGAKTTIEKLDLDCARLQALRKTAFDGYFLEGLETELTPDDCEKLAVVFRERDGEGRYEPFCFALMAALAYFRPPSP